MNLGNTDRTGHRAADGRLHGGTMRLRRAVRTRRRTLGLALRGHRSDSGMSTAEYAVGTIAACGFAAVLYKVVTSGAVAEALQKLVERALDAAF